MSGVGLSRGALIRTKVRFLRTLLLTTILLQFSETDDDIEDKEPNHISLWQVLCYLHIFSFFWPIFFPLFSAGYLRQNKRQLPLAATSSSKGISHFTFIVISWLYDFSEATERVKVEVKAAQDTGDPKFSDSTYDVRSQLNSTLTSVFISVLESLYAQQNNLRKKLQWTSAEIARIEQLEAELYQLAREQSLG